MKVPKGRRAGQVGGRQVNGTGLSRLSQRGRGRFGKPVLKDTGPEAQRKWLHHCLRTLHKALKNARSFEQRKLKRRLVLLQQQRQADGALVPERDQRAAAEGAAEGDMTAVPVRMERAASPSQAPATLRCAAALPDGEKLQGQLESSRVLDLNNLAMQLALKSGFPPDLVLAAAPGVSPAPRVPQLKTQQQRPQQPGQGGPPCEPGHFHRSGDGDGSGRHDASGSGGSDPLMTLLASRLLRASCVRKAVEDARRDFAAKFGAALGSETGFSEPESERQDSEDAGGDDEGVGGDEDEGTGKGGEELIENSEEEPEVADENQQQLEEDGAVVLRPHKRQRGLTGTASCGVGSAAAVQRDCQLEELQEDEEEAEEEGTRMHPDGDAAEGRGHDSDEDSGVIEEVDVDDFLAEAVGDEPPAGGDRSTGSGDGDQCCNDGGESEDESGSSDGDGSLSFDSEDFDLPARQRPGKAASKGPAPVKGSGGRDGGGGGGSSSRVVTAKVVVKATAGVKRLPDATAVKAAKDPPSHASRASKGDGEATRKSPAPAEGKRGAAAGSKARTAAGREIRHEKKPKKDGGRAGDPLLDRKGKNRLGQNARRRLYEKLYGAEARHVQQQHQYQQERHPPRAERCQRHGLQDRPAGAGRGTNSGGGGGGKQPSTAQIATTAAGAAETPGEHQLHPSWAAKQRQKQVLLQQAATAAPKKIRFDDGDGDSGAASTRPTGAESGSRDAGIRRPGEASRGMRMAGDDTRNGQTRGRGGGAQLAPRGRGAGVRAGGGDPGRKGNSDPGGGGGGADKGSLHPSWAARQRQKEQLLVVAPAGKKIVFED
ncbi:hypothetical protein Vafri_6960 [Volvox africanus]|uniref:Bud22 domain-containing protein n=1 Tax=Volvox africanus TaxID=51714 RepID=A0A8J4AZE9_9CHLO|nr:hypothetical protein Vafri_6960 [Volvox africanus]